MATGNNNKKNDSKDQVKKSNPTPTTHRNYINESFDVKNSMPAPSNPNQGGKKDKK